MKSATMPDGFTAESSADRGFTWPRFSSMAAILAMVAIAHSMHPTVSASSSVPSPDTSRQERLEH